MRWRRIGTLLASAVMVLASTVMMSTVVSAAQTPNGGGGTPSGGGTILAPGDINNDGTDKIEPGMDGDIKNGYTIVSADNDGWEATLYINGTVRGDILLYGPKLAKSAEGEGYLSKMIWGKSNGAKNSTATGGGDGKLMQSVGTAVPWGAINRIGDLF